MQAGQNAWPLLDVDRTVRDNLDGDRLGWSIAIPTSGAEGASKLGLDHASFVEVKLPNYIAGQSQLPCEAGVEDCPPPA